MASFVQSSKYGAINTTDTSTMRYYVIKFVSKVYTLQDDTIFDRKMSSAGELVVKTKYLSCMQEKTNWNWEQKKYQQVIIFTT